MSDASRSPSPVLQSINNREKTPTGFLFAFSQYGFIICEEHASAYTRRNYIEHLRRKHRLSSSIRKEIQAWITTLDIANDVRLPGNFSACFPGLPIVRGWKCNTVECGFLTSNEVRLYRHLRQAHGIHSKKAAVQAQAWTAVQLQAPFTKSREYFIIDPTLPPQECSRAPRTLENPLRSSSPSPPPGIFDPPSSSTQQSPIWSAFHQRFRDINSIALSHHIQEANHTAELTPWLRRSQFPQYTQGLDTNLFRSSYQIPHDVDDDAFLWYTSQSVQRFFRQTHDRIGDLHPVDALRLNSFQSHTTSQDPLQRLQESSSIDAYARTLANSLCYFVRVSQGHFEQELFHITPPQQKSLKTLQVAVDRLIEIPSTSIQSEDRFTPQNPLSPHPDEEIQTQEILIDAAVLQLLISLVEHWTPRSPFQNALVSFLAVNCWSSVTRTWLEPPDCGKILSQLIYCLQLVLLAHAHQLVDQREFDDIGDALEPLCQRWLVNSSKGPAGTFNGLRLYVRAIAQNTVTGAQIRWHQDNQTLSYRHITYHLSFVAQEIDYYFHHAQTIFRRDLCLGLADIPSYPLSDLCDNWDISTPGWSFLDDPRNEAILGDHREWLFRQICASPTLRDSVFRYDHETEQIQVRRDFAREYEQSNQRHLEYMCMLMHKGSGGATRKPEFLSIRSQNVANAKRNLLLHDGYLAFIITYHKSLGRYHASRWPVRFLLPKVGALLVQYLALVQPLRRFFQQEVQIPAYLNEYLWTNSTGIWHVDNMTRISKTLSKQSIGEEIHIQAWRQIVAGIVMKKFQAQRQYQRWDLDLDGDGDDDNHGQPIIPAPGSSEQVGIPDVFHHQMGHAVSTGNLSYGGTINFHRGLTDSGLQEYLIASQLWHQLCEKTSHPRPLLQLSPRDLSHSDLSSLPSSPLSTKHRRISSTTLNPPLTKRVAIQQQPARHRRFWKRHDILNTLQRLYPQHSPAQFQSVQQDLMISRIASGQAEIIAVLGTGEGKSLAFLLPCCLPQAATTVVIVPLVALKQDLVRRCREAKISYSVWEEKLDRQQHLGVPLLFVSLENAVRQSFRSFLTALEANEGLDRVVLDESHLVLTAASYRSKMALVRHLRHYRCQLVFLTATLPPLMESEFRESCLLVQPTIIRSRTFRAELTYKIYICPPAEDYLTYIQNGITVILRHLDTAGPERVIIYVKTRSFADCLSERLGFPVYYSDSGDEKEKAVVVDRWRRGDPAVLITTSAFGLGVDYPSVRAVVHIDMPYDMISFAQEVGRMGRDHQGGTSFLILSSPPAVPVIPAQQDFQLQPTLPQRAMQLYIKGSRCLHATMSRFLDGSSAMQYCVEADADARCTLCEQQGLFHPQIEQDETEYWDRRVKSLSRSQPVRSLGTPDVNSYQAYYHPADDDKNTTDDNDKTDSKNTTDDSDKTDDKNTTDDSDKETTDSDDDDLPLSPFNPGPQYLRVHIRDEERGRDRFLQRLRFFQGHCMICRLRDLSGNGPIQQHAIHQCPHPQRPSFINAKRAVLQRQQRQGGWLKAYTACFQCGTPQEICLRPQLQPQSTGCEFRDLVFPTAWALFHHRHRWGCSLREISGQPQGFQSELQWMQWLGTEVQLYGMRACQAARVTDWVLGRLLDHSHYSHSLDLSPQDNSI